MNTVAINGDQVVQLRIGNKKFKANLKRPAQEAISTATSTDTFVSATPPPSATATPPSRSLTSVKAAKMRTRPGRILQKLNNRRVLVPLLAMCAVTTIVSIAAVFSAALGPAGVILLTLTVPFALTAWQVWHNAHEEKRKAKKAPSSSPVIIELHHLPEVPASNELPEALRLRLTKAASAT